MKIIEEIKTFAVECSEKTQALKPLEEAAEVFGAWQKYDIHRDYDSEILRDCVIDECADVVCSVCNLVERLGCTEQEFSKAINRCNQRNMARGRV